MNCNDCPNQTDGKCCHQLIRPQGSKMMNLLDDKANDEADRHAQMMQSLRRSIDKATKGDDAKNKRFHAIAQQVFEEEMTPMDRFGR